jgi:DNA-binding SARP family transcriptional activator
MAQAVARLEYLEHHGQFAEALELARWAVSLDPLSEEAHRRVMRFAYLLGDRNAAIQAYQRCREVLWQELQMAPLPETMQLTITIESGRVPVPEAVSLKPSVPLNILRPLMLVGREREWAQLEDAWERGQAIFISGDPGVGKLRA